jgi:hypothetical protein
MRLASFSNIVRTLYTISNATATAHTTRYRAISPLIRTGILRSMPSIPFFGSLFSSKPQQNKMSYPVQKSEDEWQAVLSKGMFGRLCLVPRLFIPGTNIRLQSSSASFVKRGPKLHLLASTTNICRTPECMRVPAAEPHFTRPRTSSSLAAAGQLTSTASRAQWSGTRTTRSV